MGTCVSKRNREIEESAHQSIPTTDVKTLIKWASSNDPAAQCKAARAIAKLAELDGNQTLIVSKGALGPLGHLLDSDDVEIQRASAAALANLALAEENQERIAEELGFGKIIQLASTSTDLVVQQHAAGAIANLAFDNPAMEVRLAREGAVRPLITLASSTCQEVACEAAAALANLARNHDNRLRTISEGGLEPLLTLACSPHAETQRQAARALSNLSLSPKNRDAMVQRGAVKTFVLLASSPNAEMRRLAATAMLSFSDEPHIADLVEAGAIPTLLKILRSREPSGNVQGTVKEHSGNVGNVGNVQGTLGTSLREESGDVDEDLKLLVTRAIVRVSCVDAYRVLLIDHGAVPALLTLSRVENAALHALAAEALNNVAAAGGLSQSC